MQLRREAKEYWKERGKMISGKLSLKQLFEWMCRGWGTERHLSKPKWKSVREQDHDSLWRSTDLGPNSIPQTCIVVDEVESGTWLCSPPKSQSVQWQDLLSYTQELEHQSLLHSVLLHLLPYVIGLLFFGDISSSSHMRPDFLNYKIIVTYDDSFTMSQLQKCDNLLQEAEKSS